MASKKRKRPTLKPAELLERVEFIRSDLQALIDEVNVIMPQEAPDTDRFMLARYAVGAPTGLLAALEALEGIDIKSCTLALEPAEIQRKRRDDFEARKTPELRAIEAELKGIKGDA